MKLDIHILNGAEKGNPVLVADWCWASAAERPDFDKVREFFVSQASCGDGYDLEFQARLYWGEDGNEAEVIYAGEVWQSGPANDDAWNRAVWPFTVPDRFAGIGIDNWTASTRVSIMDRDLAMLFKLTFQDSTTSVQQGFLDPLPEGFA